jgi:hypothetical protein
MAVAFVIVLESRVFDRNPSMQWQDIRQHYSHQWLLVEAITAHSAAGKRILEHLAVIDTFPDSVTTMQRYTQLHRDAPERELYVFHTSRETLDIVERQWLGIRGVR